MCKPSVVELFWECFYEASNLQRICRLPCGVFVRRRMSGWGEGDVGKGVGRLGGGTIQRYYRSSKEDYAASS